MMRIKPTRSNQFIEIETLLHNWIQNKFFVVLNVVSHSCNFTWKTECNRSIKEMNKKENNKQPVDRINKCNTTGYFILCVRVFMYHRIKFTQCNAYLFRFGEQNIIATIREYLHKYLFTTNCGYNYAYPLLHFTWLGNYLQRKSPVQPEILIDDADNENSTTAWSTQKR